ncbi:MAG: SoxR reducing system RseC family protein [candidate division KSB1 bacterium]|nr:SoxR reducing system RseC family protein [candidate division KSB1 bacterium]
MKEIGIIVQVDDGRAVVQINRSENCGSCTACQAFGENVMRVEAANPIGGRVGDRVQVVIEPRRVVKSAALVFLLPLVFMVGGYFVGAALWSAHREPGGIIGATLGLSMAFSLLRLIDHRYAATLQDDAVIERIV